ncbi:MAG: 23S rRNA (adenine(2503)-C(2))-methyltransferase RlmN [Candidatus Pacebacteria bacterium]|nr:23S rRNA (adenine(2503)-C(2))-methyltransferase RlmN [Candidatus Paceibacterota bacterium]NUQ56976.1 23S rRNA (adenine(2503)-C(2))-methyltransferase RlmN [Candidatus Paceibacter sp.]
MDIVKLEKFLNRNGHKPYRLKQIKKAVFCDLIESWEEATTLSKELREEMEKNFPLLNLKPVKTAKSKDGRTIKTVFKINGNFTIETVLMRHLKDRNTVCVSSQAGCAMGCGFCATGKGGFKRNLDSAEIVDQVLYFARYLKRKWQGSTLTSNGKVEPCHSEGVVNNIVFMGMGEPFLNYESVMEALKILNDKDGLNIGARHISVSTCGVTPGIKRFADENFQVNLAVSLHSPDNDMRSVLMPINKIYPLKEVMEAVDEYIEKTNRKVMFEYLMIEGINDTDKDAEKLAKLMKGSLYHLNLIKYHDHARNVPTNIETSEAGRLQYSPSSETKRNQFFDRLKKLGVSVTFRASLGEDILAACGQLAGK